jgi:hypothetical protein
MTSTTGFIIVLLITIIFFAYLYFQMVISLKTTQFFYTRAYLIERAILQGDRDGFVQYHLKVLAGYRTSPSMKSFLKYLEDLYARN